jgi:hypothetical protein
VRVAGCGAAVVVVDCGFSCCWAVVGCGEAEGFEREEDLDIFG